jgi:hypothetical protein
MKIFTKGVSFRIRGDVVHNLYSEQITILDK